ncbi:MAG TPA: magnesium transporter [Actinomycetota bacterium]|nr:magnesium transporter [Actinomycetota bacterium]
MKKDVTEEQPVEEERRDESRRRPQLRRLALPLRWLGIVVRGLAGPPARAVQGTARRVADPARQVVDHFASERVTVKQGFVAVLIASLTSLVAGLTLAGMSHRIDEVDGLFVLIPVSIGMRGNIFGALAARLGTSIHTGLFEVSRDRAGALMQNIYAATLLTVATSVTMGLLARAVAGLLGIETVSALDFIVVAIVGGLLSSVVVLAVTVYVSVTSYRRGWDLDSVGAPLITAIGDVVTLPCLLVASYLVHIRVVTVTAGIVALGAGAASLFVGWTSARRVARRIVRESFPVLCIAIVLDILAGAVVEPRVDEVFLRFSALLIIVPGFLENTGALGAILAARLGSKLHLGVVTPTRRPDPAALLDGTIVLALGITVYVVTALATLGLAEAIGADYPGALRFVGIVITGGVMATLVAAVIGYYAATTTFRFGFDPDNHTIPLVTSGMDLMGVICLVVALVLFGVA